MTTVKIKTILASLDALNQFANYTLSLDCAIQTRDALKSLNPALRAYNDDFNAALQKYGVESKERPGTYEVADRTVFDVEVAALGEREVEFTPVEVKGITAISATMLLGLDWLFI